VIVDVVSPSATTGPVPVILQFCATAEPVWKTTVPPEKDIGESTLRVFVSSVVEARLQVESPVESV
jgi:hypothetical protein